MPLAMESHGFEQPVHAVGSSLPCRPCFGTKIERTLAIAAAPTAIVMKVKVLSVAVLVLSCRHCARVKIGDSMSWVAQPPPLLAVCATNREFIVRPGTKDQLILKRVCRFSFIVERAHLGMILRIGRGIVEAEAVIVGVAAIFALFDRVHLSAPR